MFLVLWCTSNAVNKSERTDIKYYFEARKKFRQKNVPLHTDI